MYQEINQLYNLTSSILKIQICLILGNEEYTLNEIHQKIEQEYNTKRNKETVYRALESLLKSKLVEKKYDQLDKALKYSLKINKIELDFTSRKLLFS